MRRIVLFLVLTSACGAPSTTPLLCTSDGDCAATPDLPRCDVATGACIAAPPPLATVIGKGDGSPSSVDLVVVVAPDRGRQSTDLAFNPARPGELWVVNRTDDSVYIVKGVGTDNVTWQSKRDPAATHFMRRPMGIAFNEDGTWATCGESNGDAGDQFTGPALFTSDPTIFAVQTADGLGSHIDMLHASPFCMGITHEKGNAYWVFDGHNQALVRYDFAEPHAPGADDHSDGDIRVYAMGEMLRVTNVPSGLAYDPDDGQLYAADTGHARIVKLDTRTGTFTDNLPSLEPSIPQRYDGAKLVELVPPGTLERPSGLWLDKKILYVTDYATSRITAFSLDGKVVRFLDTGLPSGSLAGLTIGPDGKMYFVDRTTSRVYRIDPR